MATFIEPKYPLKVQQRKQKKIAANQTLEDVAEELLNGILCQYEPPDRLGTTESRKPSGILRRPTEKSTKNVANKQQTNYPRVRWMDEQNEQDVKTKIMNHHDVQSLVSPNTEGGCNITEACMEAGIEVGCVSEKRSSTLPPKQVKTIRKMNAKQAIATAQAKSPRNSADFFDNIVFDDDGNLSYGDKTKKPKDKNERPAIALPEVPPPPNKKERFFPELCGVRINCGDEEAYVQVAPKYSLENSINNALDRCGNNIPDDDDELLMMMDELENSLLEDNDESDSIISEVETLQKHINQARKSSRKQKKSVGNSNASDQQDSKKKCMRRVVDHYAIKDDDSDVDDGDDTTNWDDKKIPASSANFLRRVWSRNTSKKENANSISDECMEDEVKTVTSSNAPRSASRSRSPSRRFRTEVIKSAPKIVHDVYESVEMVNEEKKSAAKSGIGAVLKSIAAKSPRALKKNLSLSSASLNDASTGDWDESIPTVRGMDNSLANNTTGNPQSSNIRQPTALANLNSTTIKTTETQQKPAQQSYPNPYLSYSIEQVPLQQSVPHIPMYPQIHPAHPLANNNGIALNRDDKMERQSFISAYRLGLDPSSNANRNDDAIERQSFIGAYRQGIEERTEQTNNIATLQRPNLHPHVTSMRSIHHKPIDDNYERESFIGAYRQEIDSIANSKSTSGLPSIPEGPIPLMHNGAPFSSPFHQRPATTRDDLMERQSFITAYRQGLDPIHRPSTGSMSHENIMERMSYITANRTGLTDPTHVKNVRKLQTPPKPPQLNNLSGPSVSSYRPNNISEVENQPTQNMMPVHSGPLFDSMGNVVYLHPSAVYNPMIIPMHQDPPARQESREGLLSIPDGQIPYSNMGYYPPPYYNTPNYVPVTGYGSVPNPTVNDFSESVPLVQNNENVSPQGTTQAGDENNASSIKEEEPAAENELTWEKRTRQAWERIRGGISALTFESQTEEKGGDKESNNEVVDELNKSSVETIPPSAAQASPENATDGVQQPAMQMHHLYNVMQPHDLTKRVSFGEPQQFIYYDEQDENRSTMSLPSRSLKKKKKLRGTKLVGGVIGKVKNSLTRVTSLSRSHSSDTQESLPNRRSVNSAEWESSSIHPNSMMGSISMHQQPLPRGQSYVYPSHYGNQAIIQNSHSQLTQPGEQMKNYGQEQQKPQLHPLYPNQNLPKPQYSDNSLRGGYHYPIPLQDRNGRRSY